MLALLQLFFNICLFNKGPQDLPASQALLKLCLIIYALSSMLILLTEYPQLSVFFSLILILLDIALLIGLLHGVLYLRGYSARFTQTLAAIVGIVALLQILTIPLAFWAKQELAQTGAVGLPGLISLFLLGWAIAVIGHILQNALATSRTVGVLYAVAYFAISLTFSDWLLPSTTL